MGKYRYLRLWFWWNFIIKRNEFSEKLDFFNLYEKHKESCRKENGLVDMSLISLIIVYQRNIAHDLDNGEDIFSFSPEMIKRARFKQDLSKI